MFVLRRLGYMLLVVVGVSIMMFILVRVVPGDPIGRVLGPMAKKEDMEKMRRQMGLDRPIPIQYANYVRGITQGKLGMSLVEHRDVSEIVREKLPATLELVFFSICMAILLAIPLGVISALHRNRFLDHLNRLLALFGVSFPQFWSGLMFQLIFGFFLRSKST